MEEIEGEREKEEEERRTVEYYDMTAEVAVWRRAGSSKRRGSTQESSWGGG